MMSRSTSITFSVGAVCFLVARATAFTVSLPRATLTRQSPPPPPLLPKFSAPLYAAPDPSLLDSAGGAALSVEQAVALTVAAIACIALSSRTAKKRDAVEEILKDLQKQIDKQMKVFKSLKFSSTVSEPCYSCIVCCVVRCFRVVAPVYIYLSIKCVSHGFIPTDLDVDGDWNVFS